MINLFKFVIGTVIGSFITLTSIRTSRQESIVFPSSHCDDCGHQLKPWELIPIVSFLFLRGKCHQCHHPIGLATLIGETVSGLIILSNPISIPGFLEMAFELLLLFVAECDYQTYLIPVIPLLFLFTITLINNHLVNNDSTFKSMCLTITLYSLLLIINSRIQVLGNGDIDLIFLLYIRTDFQAVILIILISSALAIIKYVIHHKNIHIPYAPYLTIAYFIFHLNLI